MSPHTPGKTRDPQAWAGLMRTLAEPALTGTPLLGVEDANEDAIDRFIADFRDEAGVRRAVDEPLLRSMTGRRGCAPAAAATARRDVRLWWALVDDDITARDKPESGKGPLLDDAERLAIEVRTEAELGALHALSHAASRAGLLDADANPIWARCRSAAEYHIAELQPDNATNHPWAAGVFLAIWCMEGDSAALVHGETLLHGCQTNLGRADRFSACLLLDGSRWLGALALSR